jgi:Ca-activated chloride channel family protein
MLLWYIFGRERIGTIHPNPLISKHLKTPRIIWGLWFFRLLIISGLIAILAGVSVTRLTTTQEHPPQDIMIVFDLSLSMRAEDVSPSRISVAREVVRQFVRSRSADQIGLIVFAGKPFVSVPFSTDRSGLSHIVA